MEELVSICFKNNFKFHHEIKEAFETFSDSILKMIERADCKGCDISAILSTFSYITTMEGELVNCLFNISTLFSLLNSNKLDFF